MHTVMFENSVMDYGKKTVSYLYTVKWYVAGNTY